MLKKGHKQTKVKEVMGLNYSPCRKCEVLIDGQVFPSVKSITGLKKKKNIRNCEKSQLYS